MVGSETGEGEGLDNSVVDGLTKKSILTHKTLQEISPD
jgi:hypothetical protein